jgi:hypothetical protein
MNELPRKEFLDELVEWARRYGWCGDYVEVDNFVRALYRLAQLEPPDLEPYANDDPRSL